MLALTARQAATETARAARLELAEARKNNRSRSYASRTASPFREERRHEKPAGRFSSKRPASMPLCNYEGRSPRAMSSVRFWDRSEAAVRAVAAKSHLAFQLRAILRGFAFSTLGNTNVIVPSLMSALIAL